MVSYLSRGLIGCALILSSHRAMTADFEWGELYGSFNNRVSIGAALRTESPDADLIGKLNLNPALCGDDNCLSFTGDASRNQTLVDAPGAFFGYNKDDGDLNYDQWDVVSAVSRLNSALSLSFRGFKLEVAGLGYFDAINHDFDEHHPDTRYQPATTPRDGADQRELGLDAVLFKAVLSGKFELLDRPMLASVGWQRIRWGESTFVVLNSLDQINPPSQVLLHQPGSQIADVFLPTPSALLSAQLGGGWSLDLIYELGWTAAQVDPGGSFNASIDAIQRDYLVVTNGQAHEDPDQLAMLPYPAGDISESSFTLPLLDERERKPRSSGQVGVKLTAYLPDFNGTELSFYALNYHSQLPYFSIQAAQESCMRDSTSFVEAFFDCNGFVGFNPESGLEPLPFDSAVGVFEYPEDIQMYGMSFNTQIGRWSLSGEYSLRPNLPLQVQFVDVVYAGLQPALPRQDLTLGLDPNTLLQTATSLGDVIGDITTSDPQELLQTGQAFLLSLPVILGTSTGTLTVPGSRSMMPDYLSVYRGEDVQPGMLIHGYERFAVDQIDITALRAFGGSQAPFGAEQLLLVAEVGVTHVWDMPSRGELQIESGDANTTHASPGADGSGNNGETDTRRLNPTQQTSGFATEFAWGYRLWAMLEYNNIWSGVTLKPSVIWSHDVSGIAPSPQQANFVEGAMQYVLSTTLEFGPRWSTQLQYQGYAGGGTVNSQKDRDVVALSLAYSF
jgi:hypothetical protein